MFLLQLYAGAFAPVNCKGRGIWVITKAPASPNRLTDFLYTKRMTWLFIFAAFLASSLLFFVEPMSAKMLLPVLGGAPGVWNTCMVFYQAGLLLGYAYAHVSTGVLGAKGQAIGHVAMMALASVTLPVTIPL